RKSGVTSLPGAVSVRWLSQGQSGPSARGRRGLALSAAAEHLRARRHRLDEPHVASDHRSLADHGFAPEDGGARIDRHAVFDGGVALHGQVALWDAQRAERYAL